MAEMANGNIEDADLWKVSEEEAPGKSTHRES